MIDVLGGSMLTLDSCAAGRKARLANMMPLDVKREQWLGKS